MCQRLDDYRLTQLVLFFSSKNPVNWFSVFEKVALNPLSQGEREQFWNSQSDPEVY